MHTINWIKSPLNNDIQLYSSQDKLEKLYSPYLLIGGVHGDEPEGVYLAESLMAWLRTVSNKSLHDCAVIPCINVDGYKVNHRVNSRGVDINRNFPSKKWSSDFSKSRYFPGESPGSELEVQELVKLINKLQPRLIIHFHSWKPCVVVTGPQDNSEARILSESSGFELVHDIGYPTPGSLGDYSWEDLGIPVICTEDYEHRDSQQSWQNFGEGLKKILLK